MFLLQVVKKLFQLDRAWMTSTAAREQWMKAVAIFDGTLPKPNLSGESWASKFSKWFSQLPFGESVSKSPPGDLLAYYGVALRMVGRRAEAISILRQVCQMGAAAPETYRHLGLALKDQGEFLEAVEQLRKALDLSASDLPSWRGLAEAQEELGNKADAARAYLDLAQSLQAAGRLDDALAASANSVRLNDSDPAALRYHGDLLRLANRFQEALDTLERALELSPTDTVSWVIKGTALYGLGRHHDALDAFEHGLKGNPDDAWALAMKGEVLMALKRYAEAETALRQSISLNSHFPAAFSVLGLVLGELGRPEEALAESDKALGLDPNEVFALGVRGASMVRLKRLKEALESYDRATQLNGLSTFAWVGKAEVLFALGHIEDALRALDRLIEIDPNDPSSLVFKGKLLCGMAEPAKQSEGIELLRKSLALYPSPADAAEAATVFLSVGRIEEAVQAADLVLQSETPPASAFFTKGEALQLLGRAEEALPVVKDGLRRIPEAESAYGLGLKGQSLESLGRNDAAMDAFRESVRRDPNLAWTWRALSRLLGKVDRPQDSLDAAERSLTLNENDPETLGLKADALAALNRGPEAIASLQRAARLDGDLYWVHEKLAELFEKQGENEAALRELDECIARNAKRASAHALRGYVLHSIGEKEKAESSLETASGLDTGLAWAFAELAAVRRELEKPDGALTAVNKALEMVPDYADALEIKGQIFVSIGENEAAVRVLDLAIGRNASPYFWKGLALDNLNRIEAARGCYEKALALDQDDVWSQRALADMFLLQGQIQEGRDIFERILTKMSSRPRGPYEVGLCGWCHYGCGRLEPAVRLYGEALSLDRQGVLKSGQFDLALVFAAAKRYSLASREYDRAIDLAAQAHSWIQKSLFGVAISDLERAIEIRYPELSSASEVQECLARLKRGYDTVSTDPSRPGLE